MSLDKPKAGLWPGLLITNVQKRFLAVASLLILRDGVRLLNMKCYTSQVTTWQISNPAFTPISTFLGLRFQIRGYCVEWHSYFTLHAKATFRSGQVEVSIDMP